MTAVYRTALHLGTALLAIGIIIWIVVIAVTERVAAAHFIILTAPGFMNLAVAWVIQHKFMERD